MTLVAIFVVATLIFAASGKAKGAAICGIVAGLLLVGTTWGSTIHGSVTGVSHSIDQVVNSGGSK